MLLYLNLNKSCLWSFKVAPIKLQLCHLIKMQFVFLLKGIAIQEHLVSLDVDYCLWYYRRALIPDAGWSSGSSSGS